MARPKKEKSKDGEAGFLFPFIVFILGVGFFSGFADFLDDLGFQRPKVIAHCIGLVVMELAIAHFFVRKFRRCARLIWSAFTALAVLEVVGFSVRPFNREDNTQSATHSQLTVLLYVPNIPVQPLEFRQKNEDVLLLMGETTIALPPVSAGLKLFKDIGRALGIASRGEPSQITLIADENQAVLNVKFAPIYGMPPMELTNNTLSGLPQKWDCNHSAKGIEVVTESLTPIFQLYYKDDTHLVINGAVTFTNNGRSGACIIGGKGISVWITKTITWSDITNEIESLHIKRVFKYPAWQYKGQFAD